MPIPVDVVPFGVPARTALARRVADAQRADPMAPVTVVVPGGPVGLALRRALAGATPSAGGHRGLCNVRFLPLAGLAGHVGGPAVAAAGRRPLTPAVAQAAARAAARAHPHTAWVAAADQPATVDALVAVFHELADIDEGQRRRLRDHSPSAATLVALTDDMADRLARWATPAGVADAAAGELRRRPGRWRAWLGAVVVYLPERLSPADRRLLAAAAEVTSLAAVVGVTGDDEADAVLPGLVDALSGDVAGGDARPTPRAPAVERLTAPAADAEVLAALRWLAARWRDGTPLGSMALVHPAADPYPRLAHDLVAAAGWPSHSAGHRPLAATVAGRVLLGALALPDHDWRRDDTMAWMACGPLVDPDSGAPVPVSAWDRCSRAAGVVAGLGQWADRLADTARRGRAQADAADGADDAGPTGAGGRRMTPAELRRSAAEADRLAGFVAALAGRFRRPPTTWAGWSAWGRQLLTDLLGGAARRAQWPAPDERQAFDDVVRALEGLADVGEVEPDVDRHGFRRALSAALRTGAAGTSRAGHGLLLGTPEAVAGTGRQVVAVVGLADGWLPPPPADDPLLGEAERRAAGMAPSARRHRAAAAGRALAAVLAEAEHAALCTSRSDPATGREQWPSRWWAGTATPSAVHLASHPEVVATAGEPLDPADRRLRSLLRWRLDAGTVDGHPAATEPVAGLRLPAARARRSRRFSRFEGRVGPGAVPSPFDGAPRSPTSLERYATCPRRHFFQDVLTAVDVPRPEAVDRISPVDRGALVHEVLERFLAPEVAQPPAARRPPDRPWDDDDRQRLLRLFDLVADRYERTGRTGWPVLWALDRAAMRRDLVDFLRHDSELRAATGAVPEAVELRFWDDDPVVVPVGDGRRLAFHGVIDRVDRTPGGAVVVDYKTGRPDAYRRVGADDPVASGTLLQLPVYALAARRRLGDVPVEARYWFVTGAGGFQRAGYQVDDRVVAAFTGAVATLAAGIEAGVFPARPGEATQVGFATCRSCDFDAACPAGRDETWATVRLDPALRDLLALLEPDADPPADPASAAGRRR